MIEDRNHWRVNSWLFRSTGGGPHAGWAGPEYPGSLLTTCPDAVPTGVPWDETGEAPEARPGRVCALCGVPVSVYNPGEVCGTCEAKGRAIWPPLSDDGRALTDEERQGWERRAASHSRL